MGKWLWSPSQLPWAQRCSCRAPTTRVTELTLPSHGSRERREGRAVLGPSDQSAGCLVSQCEYVKKAEQIPPWFELEIFCGREQT